MKKYFALLAGMLLASSAQASIYTGQLVYVKTQPSPTTPGNTRVSIFTNTVTSCPFSGWYAFDLPNSGVGAVWEAALLAALASNSQVVIEGSGNCDAYTTETVATITSYPAL